MISVTCHPGSTTTSVRHLSKVRQGWQMSKAIMSPTRRSSSGWMCRYACWSINFVTSQWAGADCGAVSRGPEMQRGDGQAGVEGCIAPAHADDRFVGFGNGLHIGPDVERGQETGVHLSRDGIVLENAGLRFAIGADVVGEIAAGAKDDFDGRGKFAAEKTSATTSYQAEPAPESRMGDRWKWFSSASVRVTSTARWRKARMEASSCSTPS